MSRKKMQTPFIVAERTDGLGSRMIAVLTAMFLANKLGCKENFRFMWEEGRFLQDGCYNTAWQGTQSQKIIGMSCEIKEKIFSENFIKKFYIKNYNRDSSVALDRWQTRSFVKFQESFEGYEKENFVVGLGDIFHIFLDLNEQDRELRANAFECLEFCDSVLEVINEAKRQATNLGDFYALHIRSGDAIYEYAKVRKLNLVSTKHATYAELALSIAKKLDKKVVLVGDDITSLQRIVEIANDENIVFIESFKENKNYSNLENFFFDVIFMSKSARLYGTNSAVVRLANYIGNQEFVNNYSVFSAMEQYEILQKDFNLNLSTAQRAFSMFHRILLGESIGECLTTLIAYAKAAIELDPANPKYKIYLLKYLILQNLEMADEMAKEFILDEEFIKTLLVEGWFGVAYKPLFPVFTRQIVGKYAHLSFIASKIYESQNQWNEALEFAKNAFEKEPKNECFKEHLLQIISIKSATSSQKSSNKVFMGAKERIYQHLAYKLGTAMIVNSQSLWGMVRLPYVLSYIKESHKKERKEYEAKVAQNPALKLPRLESYADYKEALKIKNYTSYKLGEGLIAANRAGGGGQHCFICSNPLWLKFVA